MRRNAILATTVMLAVAVGAGVLTSYPLDAYEYTGIRRLEAFRRQLAGTMPGRLRLPPGARAELSSVRLSMLDASDWDLPGGGTATPDSALQRALDRLLAGRHPSYRVALLDISDPMNPRYAAHKADQGYIPGSVGKLLVMTGLFDQLRRRYPDDTAGRARLLRETMVVADDWAMPNSHEIPVVAEGFTGVSYRAVRPGDTFSLWEWADHMISPSSNAAASMVWQQLILMDAFGEAYPPTREAAARFFGETPKAELTERAIRVVEAPLVAAGLDTADLRIRTMFTTGAGKRVPGRASMATPRQLVLWLARMEQGRLVDEWSSLEMKRLIYFTRRRYRYASAPALDSAMVYFKSGSLYRCRPEEGYTCRKYEGNVQNLMHSVALVEWPDGSSKAGRRYLVSLMSDVPKINSAVEHQTLATLIERMVAATPANGAR